MRSATVLVALSAFTTSALAQVAGFAVFSTPAEGEVVPAGKPYVVKWTAGKYSGPATLSLIGGETQGTQVALGTLASECCSTLRLYHDRTSTNPCLSWHRGF